MHLVSTVCFHFKLSEQVNTVAAGIWEHFNELSFHNVFDLLAATAGLNLVPETFCELDGRLVLQLREFHALHLFLPSWHWWTVFPVRGSQLHNALWRSSISSTHAMNLLLGQSPSPIWWRHDYSWKKWESHMAAPFVMVFVYHTNLNEDKKVMMEMVSSGSKNVVIIWTSCLFAQIEIMHTTWSLYQLEIFTRCSIQNSEDSLWRMLINKMALSIGFLKWLSRRVPFIDWLESNYNYLWGHMGRLH